MSEALIKPQSIIYITLGWGIGVKTVEEILQLDKMNIYTLFTFLHLSILM